MANTCLAGEPNKANGILSCTQSIIGAQTLFDVELIKLKAAVFREGGNRSSSLRHVSNRERALREHKARCILLTC